MTFGFTGSLMSMIAPSTGAGAGREADLLVDGDVVAAGGRPLRAAGSPGLPPSGNRTGALITFAAAGFAFGTSTIEILSCDCGPVFAQR